MSASTVQKSWQMLISETKSFFLHAIKSFKKENSGW
jgi:hypothetical protein